MQSKKHWLIAVTAVAILAGCTGGGPADGTTGDAVDGQIPDVVAMDAITDTAPSDVPFSDTTILSGSLVDQAITSCAWATACLSPEAGRNGASPNTNMSSCVATFLTEIPGSDNPWSDFAACIDAHPASCGEFQQCLVARHAAGFCESVGATGCTDSVYQACSNTTPTWGRATDCAALGLVCGTGGCTGSCGSDSQTCSTDRTRVEACSSSMRHVLRCIPGTQCGTLGSTASCLVGTVGTCSGAGSATCVGNVGTICLGGVQVVTDCSATGQTCMNGRCADAADCTYMHEDACTGDQLRICFAGHERDVDCAGLGGRCGMLTSGRAGCVFPNGMPDGGTRDAAVDGAMDTGALDVVFDSGPTDTGVDVADVSLADATDAARDIVDSGGACNSLTPGGPVVAPMIVAGPPPAMTGGTILPGTYDLTRRVVYNSDTSGMTGPPQVTFVVSGTIWQEALGMWPVGNATISVTVGPGSALSAMLVCPITLPTPVSAYTATTTELQILMAPNTVDTYTLR